MRDVKNENGAENSRSSCCLAGYSPIPSVHNMVQSIRIDFVCCPELSQSFMAATQWKCGCSFARTEVKPRLSQSISLSSLSSWTPSHMSSHKVFAATRCCSTTPPPKAAAASPYQHASARQMIHPLHVLQTNMLPPSSCFSSFWFICLSPRIAASRPDAFSFREIIGSTLAAAEIWKG